MSYSSEAISEKPPTQALAIASGARRLRAIYQAQSNILCFITAKTACLKSRCYSKVHIVPRLSKVTVKHRYSHILIQIFPVRRSP